MITEIDDSLEQSESIHRDLEDSLENENYSSMAQSLKRLRNRLVESESSQPWETLARSFLTRTHDVVSRADWQPSSSEGHENYRNIINLYGEIAKEINLATINEKWISETLLALKSRRFNQIKQNVSQKMVNLNNEQNLKTVSSLLKDLTQLEELPGRLSTQVDQIIFQLALVEKLKTGNQNLRERFSRTITANSRFSNRWNEINNLLSDAPSLKQLGNSGGFSIVNYVNRWQNWIESTKVSSKFGKMVRDQAVQVLKNNLDELLTQLKNNIKISDESKPQTSSLLLKLKNLRDGLNKAGKIKTFEESYDLTRWENVLSVRGSLETLLNTLENLKKGGLLGSNESFRKYRETLEEFEWEAFPLSYPARYERKAIRNIFGKVRDRSRDIHRSSSQDWLPGWGGRVTADQILTPFLDFLTGIRSDLRHPKVSATVGEIIDSTEMLRNELIDSNE